MEHLITKYLKNELTREEWQELRQWLDKSELNRTTLNHLKSVSSNINYEAEELKDFVWKELKSRRQPQTTVLGRSVSIFQSYIRIAAVLLIVSSLTFVAYKFLFQEVLQEKTIVVNTIKKEAPLGRKIATRLPDGTRVTLNAGSNITFPDQFKGATREVTLSGEAFFEVAHNTEKPFMVRTNNLLTTALGTSFNVNAYKDQGEEVTLLTGKVSIKKIDGMDQIEFLEPGEKIEFKNGSLNKYVGVTLDQVKWKDGFLVFNQTPFKEGVLKLERWYGVTIKVENFPTGMNKDFTGTFENENLPSVLESLGYAARFDYQINEKMVKIKFK